MFFKSKIEKCKYICNKKMNLYKKQFDKFWDKNAITSFKWTFIIALITNVLMVNGLDLLKGSGLKFAVTYQAGMWEMSLGRWGLLLLEKYRLDLALPFVSMLVSIFIISIGSVIIIKIFEIKNKMNIVLTSAFVAISPALTCTLFFPYCADLYCLAFLLALLSVYILYSNIKIMKKSIIVIILITFMLSVYQSYIGVTLGAIFIVTILKYIQDKDIKNTWKKFFANMFIVFVGCIVYLVITFILLKVYNIELASYKGAQAIGILNIFQKLPESIYTAYKTTYGYFFTDSIIYNLTYGRNLLFGIFFFISAILLIKVSYRKKISNILSIIILIILMPLVLDIIEIIMPDSGFYILEAYQFILPIILGIKLMDMNNKAILQTILCVIILFTYYLQANASYTAVEILHNQMCMAAVKISDNIEDHESYKENKSICIVGIIDDADLQKEEIFQKTYKSVVNYPLIEGSSYSAETAHWKKIFITYLGIKYNFSNTSQYEKIIQTEQFKKMPVYPEKGYIQEINNVIVVKLDNVK